jgi:hypothetical protein
MPTLLSPERPALRPRPWCATTAIEPSDATEALTAALARQERLLIPRTNDAAAVAPRIAGATLHGLGSVGASITLAIDALGSGARQPYLLALPALYPLAVPTVASAAAFPGSWETARVLASIALEPLVAPTPPSGMHVLVLDQIPAPTVPIATGAPSPSRAYRTFTELAGWLGMTQHETARLLGIGRTTPLAWRRGHEPRPGRARRLYQTHALVKTLVRRLGTMETRTWLARGIPPPLELIAAGDVAAADDRAEALIFGPPSGSAPIDAWSDEPAHAPEPTAVRGAAPRRVQRSAPRPRAR